MTVPIRLESHSVLLSYRRSGGYCRMPMAILLSTHLGIIACFQQNSNAGSQAPGIYLTTTGPGPSISLMHAVCHSSFRFLQPPQIFNPSSVPQCSHDIIQVPRAYRMINLIHGLQPCDLRYSSVQWRRCCKPWCATRLSSSLCSSFQRPLDLCNRYKETALT